MSHRYKVKNPQGIYFVTITVVDWVDLFIRPVYKHVLIDSLKFCMENKGLVVYAYVIMTSHIHLIVCSNEKNSLENIIRDFKKLTSKKLIEAINENNESRKQWLLKKFEFAANRIKRGEKFRIWKDGFHPIEMFDREILEQKLNYIHENPVINEIVEREEDYKYSSAISYAGGIGQLEVTIIE
ncbi:MAG: transposase [Bacteroidales bacterium]|nr:transposase [Bacteroidales bacterium]